MGHHFISYSSVDARDFAVRLVDELGTGPLAISVWLDQRELRPGMDWDDQIGGAIKTCDSLLFVLSPDSVTANSVCKKEWTCALKYNKPVIPLRFHVDAELPFRLEPREYIDFSGSFEPALARLRNHLRWWAEPAGVLQAFKERLENARRELLRAPESDRPRILEQMTQLEAMILQQQRSVEEDAKPTARLDPRFLPKRPEQAPEKPAAAVAPTEPSQPLAAPSAQSPAQNSIQNSPVETAPSEPRSWDPAVLERARKEVAVYIGPMSKFIVGRAAKNARSLEELYQALAAEIQSPTDRQKFLASRPQ